MRPSYLPFLLLSASLLGQTKLNLNKQASVVDFTNAVYTRPFKIGTSVTHICSVGEAFFKTNAAAGQNLYGCSSTNVWSSLSSGGGSPLVDPTTTSGDMIYRNPFGLTRLAAPVTGTNWCIGWDSGTGVFSYNHCLLSSSLGAASGPAALNGSGWLPDAQTKPLGSAGVCGTATKYPKLTLDAYGRVSACVEQTDGAGGGTSYTSGILDWQGTRPTTTTLSVGANCLVATPCQVSINGKPHQFTDGPYIVTWVSGATGSVFLYINPDAPDSLSVGTTAGLTVTGSTGTAIVAGLTVIPPDSYQLATWGVATSVFNTTPTLALAAYASYTALPTAGFGIGITAGANRVTISTVPTLNVVTFSATPVFDFSISPLIKITLTNNVSSSTISNLQTGVYTFEICQDGTGSRTFVWPTNVKGGGTIATNASKCNVQIFSSDGTNVYAASAMQTNL